MSNERKDEFLSWRGLLDPMEDVTGHGLDDREATWDRLMDRFREKPRRRLPVYGIVAACLLLALIPAARFFQDRSSRESVRPRVVQRATPLTLRPDGGRQVYPSPSRAADPPVQPSGLADADEKEPGTGQEKKHRAGRKKTPAGAVMAIGMAKVTETGIRLPDAPAAPFLGTRLAFQPAVVPKKLKVVDFNELDAGGQPSSGMASNRRPGSLRIGWGSLETGASDEGTAPVRNAAIRIKLSTSN